MADIFISYSSRDREKAEQLIELLSSAGLSVWIDKQGIDVATSWSGEIVDAIDECKAFVVLLSSSSIESKNVVREVALAFEKNKKILPLDLEPVSLSRDLQYHLAGIQRTPMTNIDSIIRAIGKLGLEATKAPEIKLVKETSGKKSLMILPFEDLSPTRDNEWFADGIVTELIGALSRIRSLRVTDPQTTKDFKNYKGPLTTYAHEMSIQYFVQGSVRKMGDQLKISAHVLDIETGDYLWQDNLKGSMADVFDIQEEMAKRVLDGLQVVLTSEEKQHIEKKLTTNADAYEFYLKGMDYFRRQTKPNFERSISLWKEAVIRDPLFVEAHRMIANVSRYMYLTYSKDENLMEQARNAAGKIKEIEGESAAYCSAMSRIVLAAGDAQAALGFAKKAVELDPSRFTSYLALSEVYQHLGMNNDFIRARELALELDPTDLVNIKSLMLALLEGGETERAKLLAQKAIPMYESFLRLNPDNEYARKNFVKALQTAGDQVRTLEELRILRDSSDIDVLYDLGCMYAQMGNTNEALAVLRTAVEKGYNSSEWMRKDPDLIPLHGLIEFQELMDRSESNKNG